MKPYLNFDLFLIKKYDWEWVLLFMGSIFYIFCMLFAPFMPLSAALTIVCIFSFIVHLCFFCPLFFVKEDAVFVPVTKKIRSFPVKNSLWLCNKCRWLLFELLAHAGIILILAGLAKLFFAKQFSFWIYGCILLAFLASSLLFMGYLLLSKILEQWTLLLSSLPLTALLILCQITHTVSHAVFAALFCLLLFIISGIVYLRS